MSSLRSCIQTCPQRYQLSYRGCKAPYSRYLGIHHFPTSGFFETTTLQIRHSQSTRGRCASGTFLLLSMCPSLPFFTIPCLSGGYLTLCSRNLATLSLRLPSLEPVKFWPCGPQSQFWPGICPDPSTLNGIQQVRPFNPSTPPTSPLAKVSTD